MWNRLSLRARIILILAALLLTTLTGGLVTIWHTRATESLFSRLIEKNLASFQAAGELENSLLRQKGYLTYYFLDGNPHWLQQLAHYTQNFQSWLAKASTSAYTGDMTGLLQKIASDYQGYLKSRQDVITLYQAGRRQEGARLHQEVRQKFLAIYDLCERYKIIHEDSIAQVRKESRKQARFINSLALLAIFMVVGLGILLAYTLIRQILGPIHRLAQESGPIDADIGLPNEVKALSRRVTTLMQNMDLTQSQLERSRESLLQSEKLALVGKLAAGVAHSIRNPLTSVKMRLFSVGRNLVLNPAQKEDLEVISEEIRHIDTILRDFLEFSKPPKLKMQRVSLSDVVDSAITLLKQRLESYRVQVEVKRSERMPEVWADPEQLKEVIVNLMLNACDAMATGGLITVRESKGQVASVGQVAYLIISDNGPGIPASIQDKIFQPFFSTKEEGTGLGLSIVSRIIEEHGGHIQLRSREGEGAAFMITLPYREEESWEPSS
ncbi:MAG: sensor histidine kinase [Deltaproteobacteria bacterium]|nr:MAG: sensor histidine kinase [Deltaproteobacteria bacterium]